MRCAVKLKTGIVERPDASVRVAVLTKVKIKLRGNSDKWSDRYLFMAH